MTAWDDWTIAAEVRRAKRLLTHAAQGNPSPFARRLDCADDVGWDSGEFWRTNRRIGNSVGQSLPDPDGRLRVATLMLSGVSFMSFTFGVAWMFAPPLAAGGVWIGAAFVGAGTFGLVLCLLMQLLFVRSTGCKVLDHIRHVKARLENDRQLALLAGFSPSRDAHSSSRGLLAPKTRAA